MYHYVHILFMNFYIKLYFDHIWTRMILPNLNDLGVIFECCELGICYIDNFVFVFVFLKEWI